MNIVIDILRQSLLVFLWAGSAVGIAVGGLLWLRPNQLISLNQYLSKWVSTGEIVPIMDKPRKTERFFYRYHRVTGAGVLIGSLVVLRTFLFDYNLRVLAPFFPRGYGWLLDALMTILVGGCALAALIGFTVLIRPSLLRDLEHVVNRWIPTDKVNVLLNSQHFSAEHAILRHHHFVGVVIVLGSLYILIVLGNFLFRGTGHW